MNLTKIVLSGVLLPVLIGWTLVQLHKRQPELSAGLYKLAFGDYTTVLRSAVIYTRDPVTNKPKPSAEKIEVRSADLGLKLIEAETAAGALYGLGYLHGQDRMWQMHLYKYIAQGRLAEMVGPDAVALDSFMRRIGLRQRAQWHLKTMDPVKLDDWVNYAHGVNEAAKQTKIYQSEFYLTWQTFEEWTVLDSLCHLQLMHLFMSSDWYYELLRERLTEIYTREEVDEMLPYNPEHYFKFNSTAEPWTIHDEDLQKHGLFVEDGAKHLYEMPDADELLSLREKRTDGSRLDVEMPTDSKKGKVDADLLSPGASNCWAVHGNYTENGQPMLACDPHLQKLVYSTWYPVNMAWKEPGSGRRTSVFGASLVSLPLITYGQSDYLAWGVTSLNPDVADLFSETIKDGKYLYDGEWHDLTVLEETIKVRFGEDVKLKVELTRNGVLIDPMFTAGSAEDITPYLPTEYLQVDRTHRGKIYSLGQSWDVRLESIRELQKNSDYANSPRWDVAFWIHDFCEKQTDGS